MQKKIFNVQDEIKTSQTDQKSRINCLTCDNYADPGEFPYTVSLQIGPSMVTFDTLLCGQYFD